MAETHAPDPTPIALDAFPAPALPALFGAAIGPVGAGRYLPLFTQFETQGPGKSRWNWAACLCTFNWMIFRRLWLPAVLYAGALLVLPLLLVGVGRLLLQWSAAVEVGALLVCAALAFGLPALWGDRLLYQHCRNHITRALERAPTLEAACCLLAQSAPNRDWLKRQIAVNALIVVLLGVLGYLAWPSTPAADTAEVAPMPIQQAASAPASLPTAGPASSPASAPVPVALPASEAAPEPASAPAPAPASAQLATPPARTSVPAAAGYHVNVGLFADPDNARRAYVKLVRAGLPAQREVLTFKGQRVTRVRAGPFATLAKANAAIAQIKKLHLDAVLAKP